MDSTSLKKLKVAELKDLCVQHNLSTAGKKDDLIARLSDYFEMNGSSGGSQTKTSGKSNTDDSDILDESLAELDASPEGSRTLTGLDDWTELEELQEFEQPSKPKSPTKTAAPLTVAPSSPKKESIKVSTKPIPQTKAPPPTAAPKSANSASSTTSPSTAIQNASLIDQILLELADITETSSTNMATIRALEFKKRVQRAKKFGTELTEADRKLWRDVRFGLANNGSATSTTTTAGSGDGSKPKNQKIYNAVKSHIGASGASVPSSKTPVAQPTPSATSSTSSLMDPEILLARRRKFGIEDEETKRLEELVNRKKQKV
ncbi:hypothetical protein BKA69DRAFT_1068250 [Paraphysoderma sedebokerense]|nr:hypothetical protein BKA69DRAFT_1068250 [Paraphysoderma sedebokerense]